MKPFFSLTFINISSSVMPCLRIGKIEIILLHYTFCNEDILDPSPQHLDCRYIFSYKIYIFQSLVGLTLLHHHFFYNSVTIIYLLIKHLSIMFLGYSTSAVKIIRTGMSIPVPLLNKVYGYIPFLST